MANNLKGWRESASIILAARVNFFNRHSSKIFDYKILTVQRSSKSYVMPGTYVFPGGVASPADADTDWLKLYEKCGLKQTLIGSHPENQIPKFTSLCITAIRETFEECGILLVKTKTKPRSNWATFIGNSELKRWQHRVRDNSYEFLKLLDELEACPDVWALKRWSNWITPPCFKDKFDTTFFLACTNQIPPTFIDDREVKQAKWCDPALYTVQNQKECVLLPPLQFYEISKLTNFKSIDDLQKYRCSPQTYWPFTIRTKDGQVYSILPGDDFYPQEIDQNNEEIIHVDILPDSHKQHRIWHEKMFKHKLIIKNVNTVYTH